MPFYLNLILSFVMPILWGERLRDRPWLFEHFLSWPLITSIGFQAMVLTPIQSFHFRFHHDWSLGYLVDPDLHPAVDTYLTFWSLLAAILLLGAALTGYLVARIPFEKPKSNARKIALGAAAVVTVLLVAIMRHELFFIGEYGEYYGGETRFLLLTPTGILGVVQLVACAAFLFFAPRLLDRIPRDSSNLL
ncbi:MAG: hypothetical protein IT381_09055 [Deltaproteobacteria bacterium]|nr:hypothetical protein [Deltaproteobacteria bacterium]